MFRTKVRLRTLLTSLSAGGVIFTSGLLLSALLLFQHTNIEDSLLDSNIAYARKLADTTDHYLTTAQRELAWSAAQITQLNDTQLLRRETDRLRMQSGFFNSVVVVNADAVVAATSPESLNLVGVKLQSDASRRAITTQKPFISSPYVSASGNYVVSLSQPVFSAEGHYIGYIAGTIFLKKQSILSEILSQHFYPTGSSISIVNNEGLIIFSYDPARVGSHMQLSPALLRQLAATESGHFDSQDAERHYLIGYASLQKTDWNIFISGTAQTVRGIMMRTAGNVIWFIVGIITLAAAVMAFLASRIASPLEKLAGAVREGCSDATPESLSSVNAWYYEAYRLKDAVGENRRAVAGKVAALNDEVMTDPLTGLHNRRGFNMLVAELGDDPEQCVIAIDIDHFKKINDWYGHDGGDEVLVRLAALLRQVCRVGDVVSRFGGEEFIVMLPCTQPDTAAGIAESIRQAVCSASFPFVGDMTVSLGVASLRDCGDRETLLRRADEALYAAKGAGRNQVFIFSSGAPHPCDSKES